MTWTSIDTGEEDAYQHPILSVASPDSIWTAVTTTANAGKILGTTDRGNTWTTIQDAGVGARFTRVDHISDEQYCYVMRSMACTKDGGKTWSYPAGPSEYTGLQLLDNEYGWAVGVGHQDGVEVYRTTNGGTTWNKVAGLDQRTLESKDQLYFINRQEGWLGVGPNGSNPGGLLRTVDGGETWTEETDGVFLNEHLTKGFAFDIAPDGSGWLASLHSGMLLKRSASGPREPGDANGDGKTDSGDLLELVKILNDDIASGEGTDCNKDGKTDVGDLICVVKKLEEK